MSNSRRILRRRCSGDSSPHAFCNHSFTPKQHRNHWRSTAPSNIMISNNLRHLIVFFEESRSRHDSPPVDAVSRPSKHLCPLSSIFLFKFLQQHRVLWLLLAPDRLRISTAGGLACPQMPADAHPPSWHQPFPVPLPATAGESDSGRGCNNRFKHAPDCG